MTDAEYELARLKEAIAKRLDWEKLWEEQTARAEAAEGERDELREALEVANEDARKLAIRLEGESNLVAELSRRLAAP